MNVQMLRVAPVKKTLLVKATPERAFAVFTARFDAWWPKSHHIGKAPMMEAVIEPGSGGRWYEKGEDGSECNWGKVLAWEPPSRLILSWHINGKFEFDESVKSEVEVRFIAEGTNATRVELEHRIESHDADVMRAAVDAPNGWTALLEAYGKAVSA